MRVLHPKVCIPQTRFLASFTNRKMNLVRDISRNMLKKRICVDEHVIFHNIGYNYTSDIFSNTKTLIFNNCDAHFVNSNFNHTKFPNLEVSFSNSPGCDMDCFSNNPEFRGYLISTYYDQYRNTPHVYKISSSDLEMYINTFKQVGPTFL